MSATVAAHPTRRASRSGYRLFILVRTYSSGAQECSNCSQFPDRRQKEFTRTYTRNGLVLFLGPFVNTQTAYAYVATVRHCSLRRRTLSRTAVSTCTHCSLKPRIEIGRRFSSQPVWTKLHLVDCLANWPVESPRRVLINMIIIQYVYDGPRRSSSSLPSSASLSSTILRRGGTPS